MERGVIPLWTHRFNYILSISAHCTNSSQTVFPLSIIASSNWLPYSILLVKRLSRKGGKKRLERNICQFPWCKFSLHGWSQTTNTLTTESENSGYLTISSNEPVCRGSNPSLCLKPVGTIIEAFECIFAALYDKIFQAYQYFSCRRPVICLFSRKPCLLQWDFENMGNMGAYWFGINSFQTYSMYMVRKVVSFPKITYL